MNTKKSESFSVGDIVRFSNQFTARVTAVKDEPSGMALWLDSVNPETFERNNFKRNEKVFVSWGVDLIQKAE